MELNFRRLRADEIDCRIASISDKGLSLLLYKDARVDQNILDETVKPLNWKRSHQSIDGRLYCTVSIRNDETGEWIDKQDVGVESYTEKEKGQASDSFKRACFNWGIGRELYTALAEHYIYQIKSSTMRRMITYRYINKYSWIKVAHSMGKHYTADGCRMAVERFLKEK